MTAVGIVRLKPDGTRAETRFGLSAKRTSPFKSAGASVQLTTGSRVVRISGNNAGYTVFRGSVRVLATHSIRQFALHSPPVRHRLPSGFNWTVGHRLTSCIKTAFVYNLKKRLSVFICFGYNAVKFRIKKRILCSLKVCESTTLSKVVRPFVEC
jgi:hypothetical protein